MEPKYVEAIKAGVIGGVILAALQLVQTLLSLLNVVRVENISTTDPWASITGVGLAVGAINCCICLLFIVVLAATGAMAVRMTRGMLRDLNDAIIGSAVAGAVAGVIWGVLAAILGMVSNLINPNVTTGFGFSLLSGICGILCCLPIGLIIGVILAVVGGAIYYTMAPKQ
jgi:hypothetical protein